MSYNIDEIKKALVFKTKEIIQVMKMEYGDLVNLPKYDNLEDVIHIEKTGTISLFVSRNNFYFPLDVFDVFKIMSKIPGYGSNKNHKACNAQNLIINDNTYETYLKHAFVAGLTPKEYYEEILVHEVLHFGGSGGGTALREGLNELKTRELALKYGLLTSGCGYPKETKIAYTLQEIFGEEIMNKIAFAKNDHIVEKILEEVSPDAVEFYFSLEDAMEKEFYNKYMKQNFPGITGPIKKVKCYNSIDYTEAYKILVDYKKSIDNKKL